MPIFKYLSKLNLFCESLNSPNLCILGDYNAGPTNAFGKILTEFCDDNQLTISDYQILPSTTFTYMSESHHSTSWTDHFVTSSSIHQAIAHASVLYGFVTSDHQPLAVTINSCKLPKIIQTADISNFDNTKVNCNEFTPKQKQTCATLSKTNLLKINLPMEAIHCNDCVLMKNISSRLLAFILT